MSARRREQLERNDAPTAGGWSHTSLGRRYASRLTEWFCGSFAVLRARIARLQCREAVGISVLSGGFKTLLGWLENSLGLTVVSCC